MKPQMLTARRCASFLPVSVVLLAFQIFAVSLMHQTPLPVLCVIQKKGSDTVAFLFSECKRPPYIWRCLADCPCSPLTACWAVVTQRGGSWASPSLSISVSLFSFVESSVVFLFTLPICTTCSHWWLFWVTCLPSHTFCPSTHTHTLVSPSCFHFVKRDSEELTTVKDPVESLNTTWRVFGSVFVS